MRAIAYENLDTVLGREIRLDLPGLVAKLVDARRGGYCFEQNTLFAAVLEARGAPVTRCLGRVRLGDPTSPRPGTHMVVLVDGQVVDVGFGAARPLGPVPLGGEDRRLRAEAPPPAAASPSCPAPAPGPSPRCSLASPLCGISGVAG